jgi:hypothetical protein
VLGLLARRGISATTPSEQQPPMTVKPAASATYVPLEALRELRAASNHPRAPGARECAGSVATNGHTGDARCCGPTGLHCLPALAVARTVDNITRGSSDHLLHVGGRLFA